MAVRLQCILGRSTGVSIGVLSFFLLPLLVEAQGVDRDKHQVVSESKPTGDQALERFTLNITQLAKDGKLEPFIGERVQIRRVLEVMSKAGNKVIFILGEAGSGKTAMVEYASGQMEGNVVYRLNLNAFEAGTEYRGTLENRLEALLEAFKGHPERVLFIDEAHVAMRIPDFMDKLKPAMARGEINLIMATTEAEYREFIEKDPALTSRASIYRLDSPTEGKVLNVLRAHKDRIQQKHGLPIMDSALEMTARLTVRYFSSEPILRKALDILDRTATREVLNQRLGSFDTLELQDRKEVLELQEKSLRADLLTLRDNHEIKEKLREIRDEIGAIDQRLAEDAGRSKVEALQKELEALKKSVLDLQKKGDLITAARLHNEQVPRLEKQLLDAGLDVVDGKVSNRVSADQIARFVGHEVGIPARLLAENDLAKVQRISEALNKRVLGQASAVDQIVKKVKIRLSNVEPITGPQAVSLFDGPTGVGKTELSKALAEGLFDDASRILRINANTLGHSPQGKLLGHEKGIVDSAQGGDFDEIRRRPYMVVSFDEVDKAPREFWTMMLQIFDEGQVKDARGRNLDFRNSVITMQGNFTGEYAVYKSTWSTDEIEKRFSMEPGSLRGLSAEEVDVRVLDRAMELKGVPPEVRNRIGIKLICNAITPEVATQIARKMLMEQVEFNWRESKIRVEFDASVIEALVRSAFDPENGARPLRQKQSDIISDLLADLKIKHGLQKGMTVKVSFVKNADERGGVLKASINDREVEARQLVLRTLMVPRASALSLMGKSDPTTKESIIREASGRARKAR